MEWIARANNDFGVSLFAQVEDSTGNRLISPISISSNLRLLMAGARGSTRNALAAALVLQGLGEAQLEAGSRELGQKLTGDSLSIANSIWAAPGVTLRPAYEKVARDAFFGTVQTLVGGGASGAAQINQWVSDHTQHRISRLFSSVGSDASLILANAVSFDGKWQLPFPKRNTQQRTFHGSLGDTEVPTMSVTGAFESSETNGALFLRLPYKGSTSLLIVMPAKGVDPASEMKRLLRPLQMTSSRAALFMPKFQFEDELDLSGPLARLGLGELFEHADLKGISSDPRLGKVSQAVHKTYIEVYEEGTEAAAATGVVVRPTAIMRPIPTPEIHIDRPFALAIRDDATRTLLFLGVVRNLR